MVIHRRVMGELAVSRAFGDRSFKMGIKCASGMAWTARRALSQRCLHDVDIQRYGTVRYSTGHRDRRPWWLVRQQEQSTNILTPFTHKGEGGG